MAFSKQATDIGRPQFAKLLHLVSLIARILWRRARSRATVLYYPPAGPDLVPVLRDLVVLLCTRWAFRSTVLHFHAGGVSEIEPELPRPLRALFRAAYAHADLAIQTSALNPPDGRRLGARRVVVVPNGVPDHPTAQEPREARNAPPIVLYVGVLRESKGVLVLIEACRRLRERGLDFRLHLMGAFASSSFKSLVHDAVADAGLMEMTVFLGTLSGDAKAATFRGSDVFCYPTYFEAESFGMVLIEAMQFALPIVATRWRGVPSVVEHGDNGFLVPVRDATALEAGLNSLLTDPELRRRMGRRGREIYLERFTEQRYRREMETVLREL
jgi:glycosyltransferase involved in cell wall biosynthesis